MEDNRISTAQAAKALGLTQQSIRRHIRAGRIKAERVGVRGVFVIPASALVAFAEKYNYPINLQRN